MIFGRIVCYFYGHKRHKPVFVEAEDARMLRCPRCGHLKPVSQRKPKQPQQPKGGAMKAEQLLEPLAPAQLVDELTYTNYAHNRRLSPHITPERWAKIYPNAEAMEARFTADAVKAQDMLRAAVEWHQRNEDERLPTPLLAILCAARQVC